MNHKQLVQQMNEMKAQLESYQSELTNLRSQVTSYENIETPIATNNTTSRRKLLKRMAIAGIGGIGALGLAASVGSNNTVLAETAADNAIEAVGGNGGYGLKASGGLAPLFLAGGGTPGAPTGGNHTQGELYVDSAGALYYCVSGNGTGVGTWRQLSGANTAGAYSAIAPARIIDTRSNVGTVISSSVGGTPSGKFADGESRVYQVTTGGGPIPTGATAISASVTALNINMTAGQTGFFTFWGSGARPSVSQVTYNVPNVANAGSFIANLDAATGRLSVFTLRAADVIIDVTGFYK